WAGTASPPPACHRRTMRRGCPRGRGAPFAAASHRLARAGVGRVQDVRVALLALAGAARRAGGALDTELGRAVGRAEAIVRRERGASLAAVERGERRGLA